MGGLNAALSVATGALSAQEAAIQVANNNIANANTPGYDREIVNLSAAGSIDSAGVSIGDGVLVNSVTSVRDQLLDERIQQQTSSQAAASAQSGVLATIEPSFATSSSNVGTALSSFFSSVSALSSAPSNQADRQTVISNAQSLVNQFHATSSALTSTQVGLNTQVDGDVTQINTLASQIASLNGQISQAVNPEDSVGTLISERAQAEQQLAGLTQIAITTSQAGDTVTTGTGTALVAGAQSFSLTTVAGADGLTQVVDSAGTTITSQLASGDLGGLLTARDGQIPSYISQLDSLASGFVTAFNAAQASGYDLSGSVGSNLFTGTTAASIALSTTDGASLAASSDGTSGSNGNVQNLTDVQSKALPTGESPTEAFASLVNSVGDDASQASAESTAVQATLTQLTNQQSATSGVSIDEESSNLIRFQQAYEAAAEVITTIRSLFNTTIDMVGGTGA